MGQSCRNELHLQKWVKLEKIGLAYQHVSHLKKCVTIGQMFYPVSYRQNWLHPLSLVFVKMFFYATCVYLRGTPLASSFDHPTQVFPQVELASTCDYLPVHLARALLCIILFNFYLIKDYCFLYNNQIKCNVALSGQSAVGYCAGKPTEQSRVFWIIII